MRQPSRWGLTGLQRRPRTPSPVGASMAVITDLMQNPQDAAYAAEAERRADRGLTPARGLRTPLMFVMALLIGLLCATAWLGHRVPPTGALGVRKELISRIEARQADADTRATALAQDRRQLEETQAQLLRDQNQGSLAADLESTARLAGEVALTGPGVEVTLDDAPVDEGIAGESTSDEGRVIARDLQQVANGLWASGAEAVSINGHPLAGNASIRFAGEAILVDYRALTRPYVITAIGDPRTLRQTFLASADGRAIAQVRDDLGIRFEVTSREEVTVPADTPATVRHARVKESR